MHNRLWEKKLVLFTAKKKKGYILEVDDEYPTNLDEKRNYLSFMLEKMKIEKVEKLEKYVVDIRVLYQAL